MSEGNENKTFKVNDRRRFDEDGAERSETTVNVSSKPAEVDGAKVDTAQVDTAPKAEFEIEFGSFIMSLASQALMQLGEMKPPAGVSIPVDLGAAKQTIEVLAMLEAKTKGNLDADEAKMMTEILHNLRLCFVKAVKK